MFPFQPNSNPNQNIFTEQNQNQQSNLQQQPGVFNFNNSLGLQPNQQSTSTNFPPQSSMAGMNNSNFNSMLNNSAQQNFLNNQSQPQSGIVFTSNSSSMNNPSQSTAINSLDPNSANNLSQQQGNSFFMAQPSQGGSSILNIGSNSNNQPISFTSGTNPLSSQPSGIFLQNGGNSAANTSSISDNKLATPKNLFSCMPTTNAASQSNNTIQISNSQPSNMLMDNVLTIEKQGTDNNMFLGGASIFETEEPSQNEKSTSEIGSHSNLISSIKDNSVNLYNLTLQEIIDKQAQILEENIKIFKKDAQAVFEQDMKLIKARNNYIRVQKNINEEKMKMDELIEALDFFEKYLDGLDLGESNEMGKCVENFESICDKFYKKVESFKDDQDEVMSLINENYQLIDAIDIKLDGIDRFITE